MILFQSDWRDYPTAVPHYSTVNKSWCRLAGVFNAMGIKNSLFHLALHDPRLKDIDPQSASLTQDEITMIIDECTENPWYFIREVIRIPNPGGLEPMMFKASRANISLVWLFYNHLTTLLIQPRQTHKSGSVEALMVTLMTVGCVNTNISLLTKDDSLRVSAVTRIKALIDALPKYLQIRVRGDANNTEKITLNEVGNTFNTAVSQLSKKAALKLGRGMTTVINHIDEFAFIENLSITLPAFLAASGAARDSAAAVNAPYGNIFTTTPGYLASESGKYAHGVYNSSFRWTELLFDSKDDKELNKTIDANIRGGIKVILLDYNHRQLGYTDEWLRKKIQDAMASGEAVEADFLGIWPESNSASIIPADKLKIIIANRNNDPRCDISTHGYIIRWYVTEEYAKTRIIIAGLDTSEAIGKDGIGLVLRDASTGEVLGTADLNETNTIQFARWLADLLMTMPNMLMVIERKNTGVSIIDALIEILVHNNVDPFKRIFNFVVNDSHAKPAYMNEVIKTPMHRRDPQVYIKYRKYFGYTTTGAGRTSRDMLYGEIFSGSLTYTADTIRDSKLINQLSGLRIKNGRVDHADGAHDDLIIAWLLGYWVLAKGSNLDFYGIPTNKVLSTVVEAKITEQGGRVAVEKREYQIALKEAIDSLIEDIRVCTNQTHTKILLAKLKLMHRELDPELTQSYNINSFIAELELEKKKSTPYWRR